MAVVFMVRGRSPRHRFNQDRRCGWTWMRYGIAPATALRAMAPLPGSVVPPPDLALPVAALRSSQHLAPALRRAATRAALVAAVAPRAHHDPRPAAGAHEHPMAVHGDASPPSRAGQPPVGRDTAPSRRCGLPRRVSKEARRLSHRFAELPSCTASLVAAPCSHRAGDEQPRNTAANTFAAVARNQSQQLRSGERNQIQLRPPDSRASTQPSTRVTRGGHDSGKPLVSVARSGSQSVPSAPRRLS
jgi:hypothetical protein